MNFHDVNLPVLVHWIATVGLVILMIWVIVSDTVRYLIPNSLNLAIIILFIAATFFLPIPVIPSVSAAALMLLVGLALFALGLMGGGDVKLLVALTLWTGWTMQTVQFLVMTAVMGGLLVIVILFLRILIPPILFRSNSTRNIPRLLRRKEAVPYGIAIAAAFLFLLWGRHVPALG